MYNQILAQSIKKCWSWTECSYKILARLLLITNWTALEECVPASWSRDFCWLLLDSAPNRIRQNKCRLCAVMVFEFWLCCFVFVSVDLSSCVLFYFPLPAFVFFHLMSVLRLPGLLCFWSAPRSCHVLCLSAFAAYALVLPWFVLHLVLLLDFSSFVANLFHLQLSYLPASLCFKIVISLSNSFVVWYFCDLVGRNIQPAMSCCLYKDTTQ